MADCPACDTKLMPTRLQHDLPALGCAQCDGVLVNLTAYRAWREAAQAGSLAIPNKPAVPTDPHDNDDAIVCPKCSGVMSKYQVDIERHNRLDYCARCEEVWFDCGEWEFLESLALTSQLTQVFTRPWQYKMQLEKQQKIAAERWHMRLGDDYAKVAAFRDWLRQHKQRAEILAYINIPEDEDDA